MDEPKIIYETLETWKGGKSSGYYEATTNEIHILNGEDQEQRALTHEHIHASRQNKITFKFGNIIQYPLVRNFLFLTLAILAFAGVASSLIPFFFTAALFSFLMFCQIYEETKADYLTAKSMKEIKRNGEKIYE